MNTDTKHTFLAASLYVTILIAVDRHLTLKRIERNQGRRNATAAAHALALGAQLAAEGRLTAN